MDTWYTVNWQELFIPSVPIVELVVRGSLVYLILFSVLRIIPSRQLGTLGITDVLVVVLFAEAAQNAMATNYTSITEGAILVSTVIFWSYFLNWVAYYFPPLKRFLNPPPLPLVKNGRLLLQNLQRELITEDEFMSQLRQQSVESLAEVKAAYIEVDGSISIIPYSSRSDRINSKKVEASDENKSELKSM